MTGSIVPRYLVLTAALAIAVVGIMLSVFYGQYRWLAGNLMTSSADLFAEAQVISFERRATDRLGHVRDSIALHRVPPNAAFITGLLELMLANDSDMIGLAFVGANGSTIEVGQTHSLVTGDGSTTPQQPLTVNLTATRNGVEIGALYGYFSLSAPTDESAVFRQQLMGRESASRRSSFLRIGATAILVILFCATVIWLVVGDQSKRIRELKLQAIKLSDADFGEPLDVHRSDEIGELAEVFNSMRDKLQKTTISRDYVDKMFSGMNEAIIVTDDAGSIIRVNEAATRMLDTRPTSYLESPWILSLMSRRAITCTPTLPQAFREKRFLSANPVRVFPCRTPAP